MSTLSYSSCAPTKILIDMYNTFAIITRIYAGFTLLNNYADVVVMILDFLPYKEPLGWKSFRGKNGLKNRTLVKSYYF